MTHTMEPVNLLVLLLSWFTPSFCKTDTRIDIVRDVRELFENDSNEIIDKNTELELNTSDPIGGLQTIVTKILR